MRPFVAASPRVEVNGEAVLAFVKGMSFGSARALRILASHGIIDPKPGCWYKQQAWLDAFQEIAQTLGPNTLYGIGLKIPDQALFPQGPHALEEGLAAIDEAYRMNHRGGAIGSYAFTLDGPGAARIVSDGPYPSDFDRGIITAVAERFKPAGATVTVELDPTQPTRKKGGASCTFRITW